MLLVLYVINTLRRLTVRLEIGLTPARFLILLDKITRLAAAGAETILASSTLEVVLPAHFTAGNYRKNKRKAYASKTKEGRTLVIC